MEENILHQEVSYNRPMTVEDYLEKVDYKWLNSGGYVPSLFALEFIEFIKAVNDGKGEDNKTPVMHMAMLDKLCSRKTKIANLCSRGSGKSSLFMEYLTLYLAMFGILPGFGKVSGMLYISDSMDNGVKSARESIKSRYYSSEFLQHWLPEKNVKFTESYLEFTKIDGRNFGVKLFGAKSGIRGTKIFNKRPVLAICDDLTSDADSRSPTATEAIAETVYSGVQYALDPTRHKIILNGTPFNKEDIVYKAIESGAWEVNVWPVCEKFPCSREEFSGAWEDRFTYDYVKEMYDSSVKEGKEKSFRQELMLRITSDESRLVKDEDIQWFERTELLKDRSKLNFYITTDFAVSSKQTADYSVISVWAFDQNKRWNWVDGICKRQTMDKTIDDLFRLIKQYTPQTVGVEINGQQAAFIPWLRKEMSIRNNFFNLTHQKGKPGIRVMTDKLSRFNLVVPLFKEGMIRFPLELKRTEIIGTFMDQISLATKDGIKGKDDCLDTISMLQNMDAWSSETNTENYSDYEEKPVKDIIWGDPLDFDDSLEYSSNQSYII